MRKGVCPKEAGFGTATATGRFTHFRYGVTQGRGIVRGKSNGWDELVDVMIRMSLNYKSLSIN